MFHLGELTPHNYFYNHKCYSNLFFYWPERKFLAPLSLNCSISKTYLTMCQFLIGSRWNLLNFSEWSHGNKKAAVHAGPFPSVGYCKKPLTFIASVVERARPNQQAVPSLLPKIKVFPTVVLSFECVTYLTHDSDTRALSAAPSSISHSFDD